ncbi:hypothetical protein Tco_0511553 [Tanacetum coccineum]
MRRSSRHGVSTPPQNQRDGVQGGKLAATFPWRVSGGASGTVAEVRALIEMIHGESSPARHVAVESTPTVHQFLDQKIRGARFSLGIVAGERFAIELTPSTFPQRHFAGDIFPQRHVAGERVGMLLGKASNVVV